MLVQPEHQLLAGSQVTECAADGYYGLAVHAKERLRVVQPVANFHSEHFAPVGGRRQGLARKPPGLRELPAGHDEAIPDQLDTRCLAARVMRPAGYQRLRGGPDQPACAIRPGANASALTSSPAGHGVPAISDSVTAAMAGAVCRP